MVHPRVHHVPWLKSAALEEHCVAKQPKAGSKIFLYFFLNWINSNRILKTFKKVTCISGSGH